MSNTSTHDQVPQAPDSERAVLGSILLDNTCLSRALKELAPAQIYTPSHREIYEAMAALSERGLAIDPVQLNESLRARGALDKVGGPAYVASLFDYGVRSHFDSHVRRVVEASQKRHLWKASMHAAEAANNGHSPSEVADILIKALDAAKTSSPRKAEVPFRLVRMSEVKAEKVTWVWPNRIPSRALTILQGVEGEGKSTMLCAIVAGITNGKGLPETETGEPATVLWLSAEDNLNQVLKPRLQAAGADCERVIAIGDPFTFDERGLLALREAVAEHKPKLVIIDPIFAYTRGDANKGNDARLLTGELNNIADQLDCGIVIVRHVGKSKGLGDPRAAGLYSIEWRAAVRSELLVGADPDDPTKRAITQTKNNLGPKAGSIGYVIQSDADSPSGARFYWTGTSTLTAERILEAADYGEEKGQETNARDDAEEFLREVLSEGPMLATDVEQEAKQAKVSMATLRRAKDSIGVRARSRGFGKTKKWYWVLPEDLSLPVDAHVDAHVDAKALTYSIDEHLSANHTGKSNYSNNFPLDAHAEINEHLSATDERLSREVIAL